MGPECPCHKLLSVVGCSVERACAQIGSTTASVGKVVYGETWVGDVPPSRLHLVPTRDAEDKPEKTHWTYT